MYLVNVMKSYLVRASKLKSTRYTHLYNMQKMHVIKPLKTERNLTTEKTVAEMNHYKEQIHTLDQNTRKPKKKKKKPAFTPSYSEYGVPPKYLDSRNQRLPRICLLITSALPNQRREIHYDLP